MSDQRPGDDAAAAAPWGSATTPVPPVSPPSPAHPPVTSSPAAAPPTVPPSALQPTPPPAGPLANTPAPAVRHRRRGARIAIGVLAVLLVAALGLAGYLWYAADSWRADSDAWQEQARAHGTQVAELQAQLDATTQELGSARDQLATATARITQLADEKAQLGDANAASQQYLDYQRRVSEAAGVVAQALGRCTDGQAQLIEYLRTPEQYDPADLQRFADEVDTLCQAATDANSQLQQELAQ